MILGDTDDFLRLSHYFHDLENVPTGASSFTYREFLELLRTLVSNDEPIVADWVIAHIQSSGFWHPRGVPPSPLTHPRAVP